jgi:MFS transporter, putative metabolite:H+ symporter
MTTIDAITTPDAKQNVITITIIVAALGYFVDIYDLLLFLIVGKQSLVELYPEWAGQPILLEKFQHLLDLQMLGMLIGGVLWGVIGDKKGRLAVLFGSIILYSVANLLNAFVTSMTSYEILRFVAGVGLAGELGAGITLVTELMDKNKRGIGTMIVASVGVFGAVVAGTISQFVSWQNCYIIGGLLGIALLFLRLGLLESTMFAKAHSHHIPQGNFFMMFSSGERFARLLICILVGLPLWFVVGLLVARAPEIAKILHVQGTVQQAYCIMAAYGGLVLGDFACGGLSQLLRSRKKALLIFYGICTFMMVTYLNLESVSSTTFYIAVFLLGFSVGFWAVFVTNASEQFGTNLRATAATSVPNFVRGSLVPIAWCFSQVLALNNGDMIKSFYYVGGGVMVITLIALYFAKETFGRDLDFYER